MPRRMTRDVDHLEGDAGDGDLVTAADRVLGIVRRDREATARRPGPQRLELAGRRPDLRARAVRQGGDAADVVDVGVRDEDRRRGRAHSREVETQVGRVVAGVDDHGFSRAALGAHDVTVALEGPHHEAVDDERHGERLSVSRCGNASRMQRWNLLDLDAPEGRRDPIVLHSDDGARAVLIVLSPGQSLGDHQVKENAWVTVIDGTVEITVDGERSEAGPGTLGALRSRRAARAERRARRTRRAAARAVAGRRPLPGRRLRRRPC